MTAKNENGVEKENNWEEKAKEPSTFSAKEAKNQQRKTDSRIETFSAYIKAGLWFIIIILILIFISYNLIILLKWLDISTNTSDNIQEYSNFVTFWTSVVQMGIAGLLGIGLHPTYQYFSNKIQNK